jgi:hypothetical protein
MDEVMEVGSYKQLTKSEALAIDAEIVQQVTFVRTLLVRIDQGNGWIALGFASWDEYLRDLGARTKTGSRYLGRVKNAGLIEDGAGIEIGTFKEGTLRPIQDTLSDTKGFSANDRTDALDLAIERAGGEENVTGPIAQDAAYYIAVCEQTPYAGLRLIARVQAGEIPTRDAYLILQVLRGDASIGIEHIVSEVSDPQLASTLVNMYSTNGEQWQELRETIELTSSIPSGNDSQVAISKAVNSDLISYLNAPARMQRYDDAVTRTEILTEIAKTAASLMIRTYGVANDGQLPPTLAQNVHPLYAERDLYQKLQRAGYIRQDRKL